MGMYTELVLCVQLENNENVIQTLRYMLNQADDMPEWEHELFRTDRWDYMLRCGSYYFDSKPDSNLFVDDLYKDNPMYYLNVRCNFKNHGSEIEKFLDWLCPYIKTYGFLGYKRYEEDEAPTLIYKTDKGIEYR